MAVGGANPSERLRLRVDGTVQGVGFRPFVYRLADELELGGWVRNDERGVELEVEGASEALQAFLLRLSADAPALASVERVFSEPRSPRGERAFRILASERRSAAEAQVAPDAGTCGRCLAELLDPRDRRYRYPFINCTDCGPRFTIVRGVPYDRPLTTMAAFEMCARCRAEYEDPRDRRFHAEPNACPVCGPRVRLILGAPQVGSRPEEPPPDSIASAARLLAAGAIVAVKGLGGYHLACAAHDERAVARLRARKHREQRPFALMARDLEAVRRLARAGEQEERLLRSPARPIVLLERRAGARVASAVAPCLHELGIMLPYTPLHHLLLADFAGAGGDALVMTSANRSDEPIAYEDTDALERLAAIADAFLLHDRPIHLRTEDSIVRVVRTGAPGRGERALALRRSRGYVPGSVALPRAAARALLACGAELKSTFCLARGERAWVSHHIGDLRNWETLRSYREGVAHFEELFAVRPRVVAHDLHPDYLSSAYAREREAAEDGVQLLAVQHHHAHLAAVLAEHGERGPAVGAIYDGSGLGSDGTVWGGELLLGGLEGFSRAGHLRGVRMPGGEQAVREPWRMACAWCAQALGQEAPGIPPALVGEVDEARWAAVAALAAGTLAAPLTSSVGRLLDALAAICGVRARASYEGQAAIELEAAALAGERGAYEIAWREGELDPRGALCEALADLQRGAGVGVVSARFHRALAGATVRALAQIAGDRGVELAVLAGGVFQNR